MRNRILTLITLIVIGLAAEVSAQDNSINAFTPYSIYGIGELSQPGNTFQRSMAGVGVAYRNGIHFNPLNPASYSAMPRNAFIINIGAEGQNFYQKNQAGHKNSYNTFNIRDIGLLMPLYKKIGMGFNMSPISSMGYRVKSQDISNLADIGVVDQSFTGEGGITEFKLGVGGELVKGLSLGANLIYYHGNLYNYFNTKVSSIIIPENNRAVSGNEKKDLSKILCSFGFQYDILKKETHLLTIGGTYQPRANTQAEYSKYVTNSSYDAPFNEKKDILITIPALINVGAFYQGKKLGVGLDYSHQDWNGAMSPMVASDEQIVGFSTNQSLKFGAQYTPNRQDIRNYLNRLSYRAGVRVSDLYVTKGGVKRSEKAFSFGVGLPLKMAGISGVDFGVEYGFRGKASNLQLKENFFKFSIGFSFFGQDEWFVKYKFK